MGMFIVTLSSTLITSCKKDKDKNADSSKVKSEITYDDDGNKVDSIAYTYNGNHVVKVDMIGQTNAHYTLEYNGDKIVKKNYFEGNATASTEYENVNYNSDGTISSIEVFNGTGSSAERMAVAAFTYSGGKPSKLVLSGRVNGTFQPVQQMEYTYTNGNITSEKLTDALDPSNSLTLQYTYDNKENLLKKLFSQSILIDPQQDVAQYDNNLLGTGILFSANNPTSLSVANSPFPFTINIALTANNQNNLVSAMVDGKLAMRYNY